MDFLMVVLFFFKLEILALNFFDHGWFFGVFELRGGNGSLHGDLGKGLSVVSQVLSDVLHGFDNGNGNGLQNDNNWGFGGCSLDNLGFGFFHGFHLLGNDLSNFLHLFENGFLFSDKFGFLSDHSLLSSDNDSNSYGNFLSNTFFEGLWLSDSDGDLFLDNSLFGFWFSEFSGRLLFDDSLFDNLWRFLDHKFGFWFHDSFDNWSNSNGNFFGDTFFEGLWLSDSDGDLFLDNSLFGFWFSEFSGRLLFDDSL